MLELLRDPSFVDKAPAQVWARLLDDGIYLCSESTMYRILRATASRAGAAPAGHSAVLRSHHSPVRPYRWLRRSVPG